jgi:hypothetical protein
VEQPTAGQALRALEPLVGEWTVEAKGPDGQAWPGQARASFRWHPSGAQPASRYWPFQGIETGIYLLLAAALIAVTFAILRRRDAQSAGSPAVRGQNERAGHLKLDP